MDMDTFLTILYVDVDTWYYQDRWLLEALVVEPPPSTVRPQPFAALSVPARRSALGYLADCAFNSWRWQQHWHAIYQATVLSVPPDKASPPWSPSAKRSLATRRQSIEVVFAILAESFALKRVNALFCLGLFARVAAKCAAFNFGIRFNRLRARPDLAHATLLNLVSDKP